MNIAGGDWRFFYPENIHDFIGIPSAWDASLNTGVGMPALNTLWISGYLYFSSLLSTAGFSWNAISLLCWVIPSIIIGFISMFLLHRYFWNVNKKNALLAGLIYTTNTYFLMILSGGQLGVVLSYGFVPLVVFRFLKNIEQPTLINLIFLGLVLSLQILFDPRITLVTFLLLVPFLMLGNQGKLIKKPLFIIFLPLLLVFMAHAYWVLPILIFYLGSNIKPAIYHASNNFSFFSFAKLENSISLLHPNWPENLFGKIYFMRPEFIVIPALAFVSLLNNRNKQTKKIVIVVLVVLFSAFLAKGVNDPFGIIYEMLLKNFPGFTAFRDPTKFYIPIALCFALLVPIGLEYIASSVSKKIKLKKHASSIVFVSFVLFWLGLSLPILQGKGTGIFKLRTVPIEYIQYKNFIRQQPEFYRTLWIPQVQRFGYFSNNHPAIGRGEIFKDQTLKGMLKELSTKGMEQRLSDLSVKYVIVPNDSEAEIFTKDNKYENKKYQAVVTDLSKIPYLTRDRSFGRIVIFKTKEHEDHFKFKDKINNGSIKVLSSTATDYRLTVASKKGNVLVFSESFDRNWILKSPYETIKSKNFNGFNSFVLSRGGSYNIEIIYVPQVWVNVLSVTSLICVMSALLFLVVKKYIKTK